MTSARQSFIWALTFLTATSWATTAFPAAERQVGPTRLEGVIASERGEPLVGAIISVFGANLSSGGLVAVSDQNGQFRVSDLPPGLYTLRAYLSGFLPSRSSKVEVIEEGGSSEPVLMKLARLDSQGDGGMVISEIVDPESEERRTAELKWLLRHGKRNVLHNQEQGLVEVERVANNVAVENPVFAQSFDFEGEVGVLASASELGLSSFPGAGSGLDARLAYARLDIPTGPRQRWEVSAQLMESILSSWVGGTRFVSESTSGNSISAGVTYGNHLYGDLQYFRPPEAGLGPRQDIDRSSEWFGSVFGAHSLKLGPADVDAGVTYHYYSYLDEPGYVAPRLQVAWSPSRSGRTVLKGMVDYKVLAPGSEDLNLLARMVRFDFLGSPENVERSLRAEKTLRSQVSLQQALGDKAIIELRLFQEEVAAQLVKAYLRDQSLTGSGRYVVNNQGDYRTRGVGLAVSRRFGSVASSVGYRFGLASAIHPASGDVAEGGEEIHDLTTSVETEIDCTRTRLLAVYRLISHPSFLTAARESNGADLDSRFNFQVYQMLPIDVWNSTEWEIMLAIRNLFYQDIDGASFLDELAVLNSPRRVLGGVSVRF